MQLASAGFEVGELGGEGGGFVVQAQGLWGIGALEEFGVGFALLLVEGGDVALAGTDLFLDVALVAAGHFGGAFLRLVGGWA